MEQELLQEIRDFLKSSNMGPSYFGKLACGNSELIRKLECGKTVTVKTYVRVRTFLDERRSSNPVPSSPSKARATGAASGTA
jgi:hypothetical protein